MLNRRSENTFHFMDSSEAHISTARAATGNAPAPLAHQAVHDTVVNILQKLSPGKLLDVPAGEGALAARLSDAGFAVQCCDLYPEIFGYRRLRFDRVIWVGHFPTLIDRSITLPVLKVWNISKSSAGYARVCAPARAGGQLIASVPNILNIEERLKWLIYGYTSHFKPLTRQAVESVRNNLATKWKWPCT